MVESTSQGIKNALVVSWVYTCPNSVFKALTPCLVYKALVTSQLLLGVCLNPVF